MSNTNKLPSLRLAYGGTEDFESGFDLPQGSLSLYLVKNTTGRRGTGIQRRPHTSRSSVSASTSASGSSIIFSTSSESASDSEYQVDSVESLTARLQQPARTQKRASTAWKEIASTGVFTERSDSLSDDYDEKSSTLKPSQLPPDFAEQLALSKAQKLPVKEITVETPEKLFPAEPKEQRDTNATSECPDGNELDFELPSTVSKLNLLRPFKLEQTLDPAETGADYRSSSRSSSSWSLRSSGNKRPDNPQPHTSSAKKTEQADDSGDDEDFLEGLEIPAYLAVGTSKYNASAPSVDTCVSKGITLQAVLSQKMKARAQLSDPRPTSVFTQQGAGAITTTRRSPVYAKHIEMGSEPFEDSFLLNKELPEMLSIPAKVYNPATPSASRPSNAAPSMQHTEKHNLPLADQAKGSRSSSMRTSATVGPARSSFHPTQASTHIPNGDMSKSGRSTSRLAGLGGLRSRPSLSNLSGTSAGVPAGRPQALLRKASANALADAARAAAASGDVGRPSSSTAHYAQPTRASLARHQAGVAPVGGAGFTSRPGTPLAQAGSAISPQIRANLASSPATVISGASRFTRPTIASNAKSHRPTGSDPSGRTSASLGMPVTSTPSSPLRSMKLVGAESNTGLLYRQPRLPQVFGDGSELDGFDDLPVNREEERKFTKMPLRRRQSSGLSSVDSVPTIGVSQKGYPTVPKSYQVGRRQKAESVCTPEPPLHKKPSRCCSLRAKDSVNLAGKQASSAVFNASSSRTGPRPALKLIRNLSATRLSQVQGQMKWNPVLLKWEGNESSLIEFDNVIASSGRPALISPLGPLSPRNTYSRSPLGGDQFDLAAKSIDTSISQKLLNVSNPQGTTPSLGGVRIVGDMIFDPVKRSWFSMSGGGEEELNFGDDEDEGRQFDKQAIDAWAGGEEMRLRTRRSFANDWNSNASSHGDKGKSYWDFELFSRKQKEAEDRHVMEMQPWK